MKITKKIITIGTISTITMVATLSGIFIPIYLNKKNDNEILINNKSKQYIQYFNEIKKANSLESSIRASEKFYGLDFKTVENVSSLKNNDEKSIYEGAIWLGKYIYHQKHNFSIKVKYNEENDLIDQFIIVFSDKNSKKINDNNKYDWYDNFFNVNHDNFAIIDKRIKRKYKVIDSQFLIGKQIQPHNFKKIKTQANSYIKILETIKNNDFNFDKTLFNDKTNKYDEAFENLNSKIAIPIIKNKLLEISKKLNINDPSYIALNLLDFKNDMIIFNKNEDEKWVDIGFQYEELEFKTRIFNFQNSDYTSVKNDANNFKNFDQIVNEFIMPLDNGEIQEKDLNNLMGHSKIPNSENGISRTYNFNFNKENGIATISVESKKGKEKFLSSYSIVGLKSNFLDVKNDALLFKNFSPKLDKADPLTNGVIELESLEKIVGHGKLPEIVYGVTRTFEIKNNSKLGVAIVEVKIKKGSSSTKTSYKILGFKNDEDIIEENINLLSNIEEQVINGTPKIFSEGKISKQDLESLDNHLKFVPDSPTNKQTKFEPLFGAKWEYFFKSIDLLNGVGEVNIKVSKGKEFENFKYIITGFKKYTNQDLNDDIDNVIKQIKFSENATIKDADLLTSKINASSNLLVKYGIILPSKMNGVLATFSFNPQINIIKNSQIEIVVTFKKTFGSNDPKNSITKTKTYSINILGVKEALAKKEISDYKKTLDKKVDINFKKFNNKYVMPSNFKDLEEHFLSEKPNNIKAEYQNYKILGDGKYKISITFSIDKFKDSKVFEIDLNLTNIDSQLVDQDNKKISTFLNKEKHQNQVIQNNPIPPKDGIISNQFFKTLDGFLNIPSSHKLITRIYEIKTNGISGNAKVIIRIIKGQFLKIHTFKIIGFKKEQSLIDADAILFDNFEMNVEDFPNILSKGKITLENLNQLDKNKKLPKLSKGIDREYEVFKQNLIKGEVTVNVKIKSYSSKFKIKNFLIKGFKKTSIARENSNFVKLEKQIKIHPKITYNQINIDLAENLTSIEKLSLLGIELPLDLRGFNVQYSHPELLNDDFLKVILTFKKILDDDTIISKKVNKIINITGINDAQDKDVLKNYKNKVQTFWSKVINKNFLEKASNKALATIKENLGITFPLPIPDGIKITYSHDYLLYDGNIEVKIELELNDVKDELIIIVGITGINEYKLISINEEIDFQSEINKYINQSSSTLFANLSKNLKTISSDNIKNDIDSISYNWPTISNDYNLEKIIVKNVISKKVTYEVTLEKKNNILNLKTKTFIISFA